VRKLFIILFILGLVFFSKTNYSPYSWQIAINPREIHTINKIDLTYRIKGFQLVVWKRLSFEPYIGFPIFTLTGELEREWIKEKGEAEIFADKMIKIHKVIEEMK